MARVELRSVVKRFGENVVIPGLDLAIPSGSLTVILGPSGCGKSTLLRLISGLELPDDGSIFLDGRDITREEPRRRNVAMVFQNYALYPHLTVRENLAFPLQVAKLSKAAIAEKVAGTAQLLGLTPLLNRLPRTLSGGERQRTAVGRAIVRDPQLFLFDEPLSNLDFLLRNQMRGELKALQRRLGKTTIYVTHDQTEAMTMADHLVVLDRGHIMQLGTPAEVYAKPANLFVAGFLGTPPMNFLPVEVRRGEIWIAGQTKLPASVAVREGRYTLGIRPDDLRASDTETSLALVVQQSEFYGANRYLRGDLVDDSVTVHRQASRRLDLQAGETVTALGRNDREYQMGETVNLTVNERALHFFDPESQEACEAQDE